MNVPEPDSKADYTYDLSCFTMADMVRCGSTLRRLAAETSSMEQAAQQIVRYLYQNLRERSSQQRCCVLVRLFKTHPYRELTEDLQKFAAAMASDTVLTAETKCLTLLATAGDEPQWNARQSSKGHQAIPLISEALVEQFPMVSQLIHQLGMTTAELLHGGPEIFRELEQKSFGIFYIPVAAGSPFVPAQQDFVAPFGIASVLGAGGMLPDENFFALIIFSCTAIPGATADMFRTIALNLKLAFLTLLDKPMFSG